MGPGKRKRAPSPPEDSGRSEHTENSSIAEYAGFLQSGIFTFLVGPKGVKFEVHQGIVSGHSVVFDTMMKGKWKESVEKVARLDKVDPDVFTQFIKFCYSKDYEASTGPSATQPRSAPDKNWSSKNYRYALAQIHHDVDRCMNCNRDYSLDLGLFPFCSMPCAQLNMFTKCSACRKSREQPDGMLCKYCKSKCRKSEGIHDPVTTEDQLLYTNTVLAERKFCHIVSRDGEVHSFFLTSMLNKGQVTVNDIALDHIRIYLFADMYAAPKLKALSLAKLVYTLSRQEVVKESMADVGELIGYVYHNTWDSLVPSDSTRPDTLRAIISTFLANNAATLMASEDFHAIIRDDADFATDFFRTITAEKLLL